MILRIFGELNDMGRRTRVILLPSRRQYAAQSDAGAVKVKVDHRIPARLVQITPHFVSHSGQRPVFLAIKTQKAPVLWIGACRQVKVMTLILDRNAHHPQTGGSGTVTPCFTPGTMIATETGEVLVEDLRVGSAVVTRDNGIGRIRWIGRRHLDGRELAQNQHLYPILIRAGAFGNGLPQRDMRLSPNHRVLVSSSQTALYFEDREVLVAAKHLVNNRGVYRVQTLGTTYIHFLLDQHEVVMSNGCWSESFQPTDYSLRGIGNAQRQEILELFPELATSSDADRFRAARRVLSFREARHTND